jgi:hypothetical protein
MNALTNIPPEIRRAAYLALTAMSEGDPVGASQAAASCARMVRSYRTACAVVSLPKPMGVRREQ